MPLLIDAYNVLHVTGVLPPHLAGVDVDGLMTLIEGGRYGRDDVCLVCDGSPPARGGPPQRGGMRAVYAGGGRSADDVIAAMIARSSIPRRLLVVTSDRFILRVASRRRCRTLRSDRFLARLALDHETAARHEGRATRDRTRPAPGGPLPASSVDQWIAHFGLEPADLARPAAHPPGHPDDPLAREPTLENLDDFDMRRILGEE